MADKQTISATSLKDETRNPEPKTHQSRPYVYELDPLRATTALVVVAVHVLAFTAALNSTTLGLQLQNALVVAVHYTREMFMFVTAFALVYVYYGKPFSAMRFWKRRTIGVLVPYCIWSIFYVWFNNQHLSPGAFVQTSLLDLLTGNSSYQMYYILLTLQFYILFPLFLPFVSVLKRYPWQSLALSFLLEIAVLYVDFHTLQKGVPANQPFWSFVAQYQNSFVVIYQFYFVLGAVVAVYLKEVRAFLQRYGWLTIIGFLVGLGALWGHFYLQMQVYKEALGYVVSVLQPIMVIYSLGIIAFFFWLAYRWANNPNRDGRPKGTRFVSTLSNASFGVYLVHAVFLDWLLRYYVPTMPHVWPVALRVFLTWFLTATAAAITSIVLMNIPILSRLVGRERSLSKGTGGIIGRKQQTKQPAKQENTHDVQDQHKAQSVLRPAERSAKTTLPK